MDVQIVIFPETIVAAIEHRGGPELEHDTAKKLIAWKLEKRYLDPLKYRCLSTLEVRFLAGKPEACSLWGGVKPTAN